MMQHSHALDSTLNVGICSYVRIIDAKKNVQITLQKVKNVKNVTKIKNRS